MPTFVSIEPDPFASNFRGAAVGHPTTGRPSSASTRKSDFGGAVRRPVRGLQLKEDTYASIQVRTADGRNVPLIDAGGTGYDTTFEEGVPSDALGYTDTYTNFILQSVQEQRAEKMQVIQTFGEPFVFFFGEHPRIIACSAVVLNTSDFNWRAEFWENYDQYLRGTKCVQNKTRVTLQWDDILVEGYFIKASAADSAQTPNQINMEFQIFLTNYVNLSPIGLMDFPTADEGINLEPDDVDLGNLGDLASSTAQVRQLNSAGAAAKNSLLSSIRGEISGFLTLDGQLTSFLEAAARISSGRNIRVPLGFAGGSVFDAETQIALASVDANSRRVLISTQVGNQTFNIQKSLATKFLPNVDASGTSTFGKFSDNRDEYISRQPRSSASRTIDAPGLNPFQKIDSEEVFNKVRGVFEAFGLDVDPPDESVIAARSAAFRFTAVALGVAASLVPEESAALRHIAALAD